MSLFQLMLLGASAFFAYKVYEHIQTLDDSNEEGTFVDEDEKLQVTEKSSHQDEAMDLIQEQKYSEAIAILVPIVDADATNIDAINALAFSYLKVKNNRNAMKYYERSLALDDNNDVTHLAFASLLKEIREYTKAQEHYKRAIEIDTNYEIAYFNYANLLVEMENLSEAKAMYKRAIEIEPTFNQAKFELDKLS